VYKLLHDKITNHIRLLDTLQHNQTHNETTYIC